MRPRMADSPLIVQMPKPAEDRPSWTKVGVITAIGFLVGVLWPRLAGVRMGPAVPEASPASVVAAPASASAAGAAVLPVAIVASAAPLALAPGDATPAAPSAADTAAQVVWAVALVRDVPKTGKVVARLPRGVAVRVGAMKDGWLPVKYGDGFSNEGWVYRGAIGK